MNNLNLTPENKKKLNEILSKVGDLNFRRRVIKMLEYLDIQPGDLILDMGCGEGFYSMIFDQLYDCTVIAVDYDQEILDMAKKWLGGSAKVTFEIGDITNLRFEDNHFDKIVCTEVLEHIPDDVTSSRELYRVLKPGGVLAVTVPNKNYPFMWDPLNKVREGLGLGHFNPLNGFWGGIWAYDHKRLYLPSDLKKLLTEANFQVTDLEVLTHYGVPFNHLVLYVGKNMYMKMPVPEEVKRSMEKFEWNQEESKEKVKKSLTGVLMKSLINIIFGIIKAVDRLNERKFSLDTSAMAVSARCVKK